jgi:hypothetical protein
MLDCWCVGLREAEEEVAGESPTGKKLMSEKPTSRQLGEYRQPEP